MDRLISEAVNAAKARAGEAQAVNDKNAARAGFAGSHGKSCAAPLRSDRA